jgi:NADPH:quinone reductase-like Zn-dependent oxidoreductase
MKRIQFHRFGGPEQMLLEEFELSQPGPNQVVVGMRAASLNPTDIKQRQGKLWLLTGRSFPRPMGSEFSGIVTAVGESVTRFQVGDAVFGAVPLRSSGAFAEWVMTDEKLLVHKPSSVSFELASTLSVAGLAAEQALNKEAKLNSEQLIFINGCLGGVGQAAVQLACSIGAKVAGSCRGNAMEKARSLGVSDVFDFASFDPIALKGRFDVVFDAAAKLSWAESRTLLRPGGICVDTNLNFGKLIRGTVGGRYKLVAAIPTVERLQKVAELARKGILSPSIGAMVPLTEAISAIRDVEENGTPNGKLVITNTIRV